MDYIYILLPADAPADMVMVHERMELGDDNGLAVLFADGHVEKIALWELEEALQRTQDYLDSLSPQEQEPIQPVP